MAAELRNANPSPPALWRDLAPLLPPDTVPAPWSGPRWWWAGALDVEGLALGSLQTLATALTAGTAAAGRRRSVTLTSRGAAASFASYAHLLRVDGKQLEHGWPPPRYGSSALAWE